MLKFEKMHGLGNHFIFVTDDQAGVGDLHDPTIIRGLCDVRRGIGADGIVLIGAPLDSQNHCRMRIFNSDGSEAEMCGNAIRCVAHHQLRLHPEHRDALRIETKGGVKVVRADSGLFGVGRDTRYRVAMGVPDFDLVKRGELLDPVRAEPLAWQGRTFTPIYVSMGNPHAVIFADPPLALDEIRSAGPLFETHRNHPKRINVEFVRIENPHRAIMTVWERGCGLTEACGTGACATGAAGFKTGRLQSPVDVVMPGGTLTIEAADDGQMLMTGPVQVVCQGTLDASLLASLRAPGA